MNTNSDDKKDAQRLLSGFKKKAQFKSIQEINKSLLLPTH